MPPIESLIERCELLARRNARARRTIACRGVVRRYEPGETLWFTGDTPRGLYVILEGTIRIVRGSGARQHVVHVAAAGASIGEVPLFDAGPYPATAIVGSRATCLFIDRESLVAIIRDDPTLALELLSGLSRRVRQLVDQLSQTTLWTVRSRIASYLLGLTERRPSERAVVRLDLSQAALAEQLGTVREVLARELATLRRHGVLRTVGRRTLEIVDPDVLRQLAAGEDALTRRSSASDTRPDRLAE